jgi:hypothetical protein
MQTVVPPTERRDTLWGLKKWRLTPPICQQDSGFWPPSPGPFPTSFGLLAPRHQQTSGPGNRAVTFQQAPARDHRSGHALRPSPRRATGQRSACLLWKSSCVANDPQPSAAVVETTTRPQRRPWRGSHGRGWRLPAAVPQWSWRVAGERRATAPVFSFLLCSPAGAWKQAYLLLRLNTATNVAQKRPPQPAILFTHPGASSYYFLMLPRGWTFGDVTPDLEQSNCVDRENRRRHRRRPETTITMHSISHFSPAGQSAISRGIPSPPCAGAETAWG